MFNLINNNFGHVKCFCLNGIGQGATATVRVRQGELRGAARALPAPAAAAAGEHYFSFKGIPYAQPPVGKHRFKVGQILSSVK